MEVIDMSVVFDEVVTQVEAPPKPIESLQSSDEQQSPESQQWQQQQATFWRRQQRLEAD